MPASVNDKFRIASGSTRPVVTTLSLAKANGATTCTLTSATGWNTTTGVDFMLYRRQLNATTGNYEEVAGTRTTWIGELTGTTMSNMQLKAGTEPASGYAADGNTIVVAGITARWADDIANGILNFANQNGTLKTSAVQAALSLGTDSLNGWNALGYAPNTVTYNGNRSYDLVFNTNDLTGVLSAGMRLRTTRTVAAPTQCTSLNGTTQYYSKSSPAGMTFTDNFTVMGWVKPTSYAQGSIGGRADSTPANGYYLEMQASGQLDLIGYNAGASNYRKGLTYQSLPLNKWVHVAATWQSGTITLYIDGVAVPSSTPTGGTAPTTITQGGDLAIGRPGAFAGQYFPGKIAQFAVFSSVLSQATIRTYISQGLAGTETSLISAYSFNNSITDLNTTNANNLTANGSAVATNADSPFGNSGVSTTLDYAIVSATPTFSTNTTVTVQVPEGCTIPTSGGVSAVVYSSNAVPYGFPGITGILAEAVYGGSLSTTATGSMVALTGGQLTLNLPANRRVKISVIPRDIVTSGGTPQIVQLGIFDGSTEIARAQGIVTNTNNSMAGFLPVAKFYSGAGGPKTYNIAACASNAGTTSVNGSSNSLMYFTVELDQPW